MFGRQSGIGGGNTSSSSNLVEFRAGRMNMIGKMVHPDARKGLVYLTQSEDGLMHFCWKDRTTGKVEDDLIVFPDDFEFKRVEQCKTGRVYVLKFKSSSRRMFFWMQEPKVEKDDELCRRVNELMNNPPSQQRNNSDNGDLQYMLNNMSQQQLMQLFGGVGQMGGLTSLLGSMNRAENSSRTPARQSSNSTASNLLTPESNTAPKTPSAPKGKGNRSAAGATSTNINANLSTPGSRTISVDLSTALTGSEAINQIISDPERAKTLSVHLPESEDADENKKQQIKDTIASPQFQQALSLFSNALQSAQLGPVVSQFELTPEAVAAAYAGNLEDFVKALEKSLPAGATMDTAKAAKEPEKDKEPLKNNESEDNKTDKK
ncbi:proteasomal ubiquitin receptor ADRM1 homolog [Zeugodacus cucurbitae]|uniref:proteasomal ubiquitin receptor ADRM1 homolog n=1 Tax=Zeugodacus cucurbitae TaxID=28588 RepID=UPI0005967CAD|nr:proteasomal ubiquitin receptor ADRM1 homolog [Zeugodacus cucurbitae]XP_054089958.1 proteasomal ubiquitin receptor ADRM1 homolog [Zeugodacus cucurbitae]XP_054089960.1 proteasomal ubiquitin receptor ADRM1 homolog [Zeugodacus cucurbitae]